MVAESVLDGVVACMGELSWDADTMTQKVPLSSSDLTLRIREMDSITVTLRLSQLERWVS